MSYFSEDTWINWVDRLSEDNYVVIDDFITDEELDVFLSYFHGGLQDETFKKAGIGTSGEYQLKAEIRGDYIRWLDQEKDGQIAGFFNRVEEAIQMFNRYCYLSLSGSELHMAHYPVGTYYKRHLDQLSKRSSRLITVILYLNKNWKEGDGGELALYLDNKEEKVAPIAKRMVFMRSDLVEHEVLMTNADRYSLTGWLLYKPAGLTYLT